MLYVAMVKKSQRVYKPWRVEYQSEEFPVSFFFSFELVCKFFPKT